MLNTLVSLSATPASGWRLQQWGGACSGTGSCNVSMNSVKTVSATFVADPLLTVSRLGRGLVTSVPAGISCGEACEAAFPQGSNVLLSATPDPGMVFAGWSGACSGMGDCALSLDSSQAVRARFVSPVMTIINQLLLDDDQR